MDVNEYRITKTRAYLVEIIQTLTTNNNFQINADMLGNVDDYSLDKISTESVVTRWVNGKARCRDVYSFRSRKAYSKDTINNLKNIGFFEQFAEKIETNNRKGILPNINGIESIECLNDGTMISTDDGNSAIFDIQIQVTYIKDNKEREVSL